MKRLGYVFLALRIYIIPCVSNHTFLSIECEQ